MGAEVDEQFTIGARQKPNTVHFDHVDQAVEYATMDDKVAWCWADDDEKMIIFETGDYLTWDAGTRYSNDVKVCAYLAALARKGV